MEDLPWESVIVPALVAVVLVPAIQYLLDRRGAKSQGAFDARVKLYEDLLYQLGQYKEWVHWLPPNYRGPVEPFDGEKLSRLRQAARFHASPMLLAYIRELEEALEESKLHALHITGLKNGAERGGPRTPAQDEFRFYVDEQHRKRKVDADKWADESYSRLRIRMRYELYGWRELTPLLRLRMKPIATRIRENQGGGFFGGVDHVNPPQHIRAKYPEGPTQDVTGDA